MNSLVALPILAAVPTTAPAMTPAAELSADPIFAAIDAERQADAAVNAVPHGIDIPDDVGYRHSDAFRLVLRTRPTTPAGLAALTTWARERLDWLRAQGSNLFAEDLCTLAATIDDAARGMSGLKAWSPPNTPASDDEAADAKLIALGRKYEPLVAEYYAARASWGPLLTQINDELDTEFGTAAELNYEICPEKDEARREKQVRYGFDAVDDRLSAVGLAREPIEWEINKLTPHSREGLRAKAAVAFYHIASAYADFDEYDFDDAQQFQRLFRAVAEYVGLSGAVSATGRRMPPLFVPSDEDYEGLAAEEQEEA